MLEPGWIRLLSKELRRWLSMIEVQVTLVKGSPMREALTLARPAPLPIPRLLTASRSGRKRTSSPADVPSRAGVAPAVAHSLRGSGFETLWRETRPDHLS